MECAASSHSILSHGSSQKKAGAQSGSAGPCVQLLVLREYRVAV